MDENTMTQINETEKKAVKHRGKTIAILVLSVLLAASVTLNITGLVRGHGMRTAMNDRIEQFDGGQMQGPVHRVKCRTETVRRVRSRETVRRGRRLTGSRTVRSRITRSRMKVRSRTASRTRGPQTTANRRCDRINSYRSRGSYPFI